MTAKRGQTTIVSNISENCDPTPVLPDPFLLREALNQELILGREDFKNKIERMTKRQARPGKPGRPGAQESGLVYNVF